MVSVGRLFTDDTQGSIFSAIGRGINAIVSAIAGVIMAIVGAITTYVYYVTFCETN